MALSGYWRGGYWHQVDATTGTAASNLTRNQLIELAYRDIGYLAEGEVLAAEALDVGIQRLNLYIRQLDVRGVHLWAVAGTPTSLTLVAATNAYDFSFGLPAITELVAVAYRDGAGNDTPLELMGATEYAALTDKDQAGDPEMVYLTDHQDLVSRVLYVWPVKGSVTTESLQLWYQQPLSDFSTASDDPDLPQQWTRHLEFQLAADLAPSYGSPVVDRAWLKSQADDAYNKIFRSTVPNTTTHHDKVTYY
jgi:hypothetical protein